MTDPAEAVEAAGQPVGPPFTITVTLDGWKALERRVRDVEQRAAAPIDTPPPSIVAEFVADQGAADRLDRHRTELEALKRWCNDVNLYLRQILPATIPPPPNPTEYL